MTVTIPTAFTEYDWLELIAFDSKVNSEGYSYAAENYAPRFETPEMQAVAADGCQLKFLYDSQRPSIDAWRDAEPNAVDLVNAHIDEERRRRQDACLWGIRCTDGYVIACDTREYRDQLAASMHAEEARPGRRKPAALLQRFFAGAAWHETRLPV